ncbi:MAG TPA: nickel-dependent lactate racemase, partial [Armatimonadota bacterium]|nr:nickel-dependent lactate racemase [Armatimonadota bacterium]
GLSPERVTILIGTGSHRGNTPDELREMLGDETMDSGARIVNHDAHDPDAQVVMGETSRGTPAHINRIYAEADLKLAVSLVEPHLIAGFSGGRKAVCPGVCGMETLLRFHSPPLVNPDEACAGQIHGNPAHEESLAVTRLAGAPELMVNVTLDETRRMTGVFAGELEAAHLAAAAHSYKQGRSAIDEPVDIVVTSAAGYPLDLTFYQSVKGIAGPVPIIKPGGTIIIACECAEGIGDSPLVAALFETDKLEDYVPRVRDAAYFHMDQWYAQFTKIRRVAGEVMVFTDGVPNDDLAKCFVTPIDSVEEGVAAALAKHGSDASIAVLPEGPYVLSCLAGDRVDQQQF